jgi:hypothetical protein
MKAFERVIRLGIALTTSAEDEPEEAHMANDEIEQWRYRRDVYLARRTPEETRSAARAAVRIVNARDLATGAMRGMVNVHREANQVIRDNPGLEFAVLDLEATYQAGCVQVVARYLLR